MDCRHAVEQQKLHPFGPCVLFQRPDQPGTVTVVSSAEDNALRGNRPRYGGEFAAAPRISWTARGADRGELYPMVHQKMVGLHRMVGKRAYQLAIVPPRQWIPHRPPLLGIDRIFSVRARPVQEELIRRIFDPSRLLQRVAAPQLHPAAAHNGAASDVKTLFDHNHLGTRVTRRNRRRHARRAGAEHHHVGFHVPVYGRSFSGGGGGANQRRCPAESGGPARPQEATPAERSRFFLPLLLRFVLVCHLFCSCRMDAIASAILNLRAASPSGTPAPVNGSGRRARRTAPNHLPFWVSGASTIFRYCTSP